MVTLLLEYVFDYNKSKFLWIWVLFYLYKGVYVDMLNEGGEEEQKKVRGYNDEIWKSKEKIIK